MRIGAPLNHEPTPSLQWIEIASSFQLPGFHLVGLPNAEVNEAKERVRAAIEAHGFEFPKRRLTLNLSPSSIRKRGTGLDLAIALAIIQSAKPSSLSAENPNIAVIAWAELGLDGTLKPVGQTLRATYACRGLKHALLIVSEEEEASARRARELIREAESPNDICLEIHGVRTLKDAWRLIESARSGSTAPERTQAEDSSLVEQREVLPPLLPLSSSLERVICTAAAGAHHILLLGPRGTGKSHALEWLSVLQPRLSAVNRLRAGLVSELRQGLGFSGQAPIRRIAAQVKPAALLGSTADGELRPGELSLADGGLLIADEFPEWHRDSRECLREPLERGKVTLTRARHLIEFPAAFALAANGNLCPCGGWPPELPLPIDDGGEDYRRPPRCRCGFRDRTHYLNRLSGPILERIDLITLVPPPPRMSAKRRKQLNAGEQAKALREKVMATRNATIRNWGEVPARIPVDALEDIFRNSTGGDTLIPTPELFSLRSRHKIFRVALTLAAWDGLITPRSEHFMEAALYRPEKAGLCA